MLRYYKNLPSALTELYPQLAWDVSKFQGIAPPPPLLYFLKFFQFILFTAGGKDWRIPAVRRSFFDAVARELGIDPLVPSNWFPVSIDTVMHHKVSLSLLSFLLHHYYFDTFLFSYLSLLTYAFRGRTRCFSCTRRT